MGQGKGLFSPVSWEQMINHSFLFEATRTSLTINPFKNHVFLGNLHVWPRCCWSLGMLMAAMCSMDCQMAAPYSCVCMPMLVPGRGEKEGNVI